MTYRLLITTFLFLPVSLCLGQNRPGDLFKPNNELIDNIKSTKGMVALWKFDEQPGQARTAIGEGDFPLQEANVKIERISEGPVSGYSIKLAGSNYLSLANDKTGNLNIYGDEG
jgi:hypothetical protein